MSGNQVLAPRAHLAPGASSRRLSGNDRRTKREILAGGGLEGAMFWLSAVVIILSFTISGPLLNQFVNYTVAGGNTAAKFHPATYCAAVLFLLVLADRRSRRGPVDRTSFLLFGSLSALMVYLAFRDKGAFAAVVTDIYIVPVILLMALSRLPVSRSAACAALFVWIALFNAVLVLIEFSTRSALLPVVDAVQAEQFFRPAGLSAHPIVAGTLFYCALFLLAQGTVRVGLRRPFMLLLLAATAACGVRGPLAMATLILLINLVSPFSPRKTVADYVFDIGMVATLPIVGFAAYAFGSFDRILELGIWESSAQSRFLIFDALRLLTESELWSGVSYDVVEALAVESTGGRLVENFFVLAVFAGGLPFGCALAVLMLVFHWRAMRISYVFAIMVAAVALSTLGFGVKNQIPMALALTGYVIWRFPVIRHSGIRASRPRYLTVNRPLARPTPVLAAVQRPLVLPLSSNP